MSVLSQRKPKRVSATKAKRAMYQPLDPPKPSTREPPPAVYALTAWSVRKSNGQWQIAPTARFEEKPQWSKPYATLQRATTAIARKLADEAMRRTSAAASTTASRIDGSKVHSRPAAASAETCRHDSHRE
jgi:hypothetical protein